LVRAVDDFIPIRTPDGWQLTVPGPGAEPLVLELIKPKVTDGVVKGVLVVRCGEALVSDDVLTLTSASKRSQLIKRLKALGITLSEKVILALDHVCRLAQPEPFPTSEEPAGTEADDAAGVALPLDELLAAIVQLLERYLVFRSSVHAMIVALWIAHAHALPAFDVTAYLHVQSPQKRSGKTRLLEVIEQLVPRPWLVADVTAATVFRKIARDDPTLLLDEADTIWRAKESETAQALRSVLNVGHRRGTKIPRCVGKHFDQIAEFPAFGAKALAGIGRLPDTVADRSVCLLLKRKKKGETTKRFRFRTLQEEARPLRRAFAGWATGAVSTLRDARPDLPEALDDRAADIWEPLLAIADLAGGSWPTDARRAALTLHAARGEDDSVGVLLLRAIWETFEALDAEMKNHPPEDLFAGERQQQVDRISTVNLLVALVDRDAEPWGGWWGTELERALEKKLPPRGPAGKLAALLRPFEVQSRNIRTSEGVLKGYLRADFADAFERYLSPSSAEGRDNATTHGAQGFEASRPGSGVDEDVTEGTLGREGSSRRSESSSVDGDGRERARGDAEGWAAETNGDGPDVKEAAPAARCPKCGSKGWTAPVDSQGYCSRCGPVTCGVDREPGSDDGEDDVEIIE
jgi:hypothetical protein